METFRGHHVSYGKGALNTLYSVLVPQCRRLPLYTRLHAGNLFVLIMGSLEDGHLKKSNVQIEQPETVLTLEILLMELQRSRVVVSSLNTRLS